MNDAQQYCGFDVGGLFLGVDVRRVQEVIRHQPMARVPLAPPELAGLINLRGQIVPAVDLRKRLGMADRSAEARSMNVVVRTPDGAVSLLVDDIDDVVTPDGAAFEPPPPTLRGPVRDLVDGVFKLKGRLLLVLNTEKAIEVAQAA